MGIFNYNGVANTIDEDPKVDAKDREIATAAWVKARMSEISPTGNCATGQTSGTATSTSVSTSSASTTTSGTSGAGAVRAS
jgi:hypothetical protein